MTAEHPRRRVCGGCARALRPAWRFCPRCGECVAGRGDDGRKDEQRRCGATVDGQDAPAVPGGDR